MTRVRAVSLTSDPNGPEEVGNVNGELWRHEEQTANKNTIIII